MQRGYSDYNDKGYYKTKPKKGGDGRKRRDRKDNKKNAKKPFYTEHISEDLALKGIETGKYLKGMFRVNAYFPKTAYATAEGLLNDIRIDDYKNQNRALHGDTVVLELLPIDTWEPLLKQKPEELAEKSESESELEELIEPKPEAEDESDSENNDEKGSDGKTEEVKKDIQNLTEILPNMPIPIEKEDGKIKVDIEAAEKKEKIPVKPKYADISKMPLKEKIDYINNVVPTLRPIGKVVGILKSPLREETYIVGLAADLNIRQKRDRQNNKKEEKSYGHYQKYEEEHYYYDNDKNYRGKGKYGNYKEHGNNNEGYYNEGPRRGKGGRGKNNYYGNQEYYEENYYYEEYKEEVVEEVKAKPTKKYIRPTVKYFMKMDINDQSLILYDEPNEYYLCQYIGWPVERRLPLGRIIRPLGIAGTVDGETSRVLAEYMVFPEEFSPEVMEELKPITENLNRETNDIIVKEADLKERVDLRKKRIITIDNDDTRDIDDAVHVEKINENCYEMGVHIADVSYYVKDGTLLDKQAKAKATSIYLVHKVHPMLPEILTCNACSLNPNVDRFAFSVIFRVDANGLIIKDFEPKMFKSIIRSHAKMAYSIVQGVLDGDIKSDAELAPDRKIHGIFI